MSFTEIAFAIFMPLVFSIYWLLLRQRVKAQNVFLLAASYLFYGWWDWRFLGLIMLTTTTTYLCALGAHGRHGKLLTVGSIAVNTGILIVCKYLNFFSENLRRLFDIAGWSLDWFTIDILLPVGVSFYTFQAIAYSVDVYKGKVKACPDFINFATFIAYFPQLVAGPIERASQLLPQLETQRKWNRDYATSGMRMILFGVVKKVCVADMLALYTEQYFTYNLHNPIVTLTAGLLFTLEIYCDFSAYSEIARGVSRLLGIELMANFRMPYFSRNIIEFWKRWHISLMLWFRDYIYIPLGGNRRGTRRTMINISVVFLLSGLWHGAAWNFIAWGAYWAIAYLCGRFILKLKDRNEPISLKDIPDMLLTMGVVTFGFYIFRCSGWEEMYAGIVNLWVYVVFFGVIRAVAKLCVDYRPARIIMAGIALTAIAMACCHIVSQWTEEIKLWWLLPMGMMVAVEWHYRNMEYPLQRFEAAFPLRLMFYWLCIAFICISEPVDMKFIYFQF